MPALRRTVGAARVAALFVWTIGLFSVRLVFVPFRMVSASGERAVRRWLIQLWGQGALLFLGGRLRIIGEPPKPPYLLVSNHVSYVDIFALQAILGPSFVAKAEVERWPIFGFIARHLQTIFIDRRELKDVVRVGELVSSALEAGYGVHIFAEGGIPKDGEPRPFKPALLELAVRRKCPVHYASISYATREGEPTQALAVHWLPPKSFGAHMLDLASGPPFEAVIAFGHEPALGSDRKALARELTEAVRALGSATRVACPPES